MLEERELMEEKTITCARCDYIILAKIIVLDKVTRSGFRRLRPLSASQQLNINQERGIKHVGNFFRPRPQYFPSSDMTWAVHADYYNDTIQGSPLPPNHGDSINISLKSNIFTVHPHQTQTQHRHQQPPFCWSYGVRDIWQHAIQSIPHQFDPRKGQLHSASTTDCVKLQLRVGIILN